MDRSVLNKATSPDETPTPGYLYTEIAKATFTDLSSCQQLADYLLKKLERDNPHVKLKVLKIIKHVCEQGKPEFRRAIQKKAELVKACLQYRGTPDPLKGDAPNKAVREEADVAVKAVFSSDSSLNAYGLSNDTGKKMQGFGSDSADDVSSRIGGIGSNGSFGGGGSSFGSNSFGSGGAGGAKSFGSGGMVGFGNPNFDNAPKKEEDTMFKQAMSSTMSAVSKFSAKVTGTTSTSPSMPEPPGSTYRPPAAGGGGCGGGGNSFGGSSFGGSGGGYAGNSGGFGSNQGGRWGSNSGSGGGSTAARPAVSSSAGEYEARLVAELCAPGGARVAPSSAALEDFCRKAESLDSAAVGDQLRQKLSMTDWQTRLKALHAVEALSQHGLDGIVGHVSQFSSELLFECQQMPQCRQKASKVLHLLGFIDQPDDTSGRPKGAGSEAATASAPPPAVDLLDMDDGPAVSAAPSQVNGTVNDLLQESAPVSNGVHASNGTVNMLDLGSTPIPAPDLAAGGSGGSLFGNLAMHSTPAPDMSSPAELPPQAQPSLLGAMEAPAAQPALFSNLQFGGSGDQVPLSGQFGSSASMPSSQGPGPAPGQCSSLGQQQQQQQQMQQMQMLPQSHDQNAQERANRTAHLNILSGPGPGMGMPATMGGPMQVPSMGLGAPSWPQPQMQQQPFAQGLVGPPMGNGMAAAMGPNAMGGGMVGAMSGSAMGGSCGMGGGCGAGGVMPGGMGMGPSNGMMPQSQPQQMQQQPQMIHQQMQQAGAYMPPSAGPQAPFPCGAGSMPTGMGPGPAMSGPGGSAFGFIGGGSSLPAGGCDNPHAHTGCGGRTDQPVVSGDSAFSFVADQMKGAAS